MAIFSVIYSLVGLALFGFIVYFVFKQIEFYLQATNLYKKMIERQDTITTLLFDIRDGSKKATINLGENDSSKSVASAEKSKMILELSPAENSIYDDYKKMMQNNDNIDMEDILTSLAKKYALNKKCITNAIKKGKQI